MDSIQSNLQCMPYIHIIHTCIHIPVAEAAMQNAILLFAQGSTNLLVALEALRI